MTYYRRALRPLDAAFEALRDSAAPPTLLAEVQRVWGDAVGTVIAAEAAPTAERAGVLTVTCSAGVWAQELDLMAPSILERLNDALASGRIERLRCVCGTR
jgi:predicted nucleic acid-binding Zn ribbon protein